jgi:L-alanine-DL-glutamate epimerase-like enolase superfamily enzyme
MVPASNGAPIGNLTAAAYQIPTDNPEADGTMAWTSTTLVVVEVRGGGKTGLGYTYTDGSVAQLINKKLAEAIHGSDVMDSPGAWRAMQRAVRNMGRDGLAATAISAIDTALWDLKAKLLDLTLVLLLGRHAVPIYGSGEAPRTATANCAISFQGGSSATAANGSR